MSEMVERVAQAIQAAYGDGGDSEIHGAALEAARAAIEAMRKPTDAMEIAGHGTSIDVDNALHIVSARGCWQAMIDEALR